MSPKLRILWLYQNIYVKLFVCSLNMDSSKVILKFIAVTAEENIKTNQGEANRANPEESLMKNISWAFPDFAGLKKDDLMANQLTYSDEYSEGIGQEIALEGIYLWYGKFRANSPDPIVIDTSGSHIQMNFCLQNTMTYLPESGVKPFVRFKAYQHNLLLLPKRKMAVKWLPDNEIEVFCINLSTEFFFNNLPENHSLRNHFQAGIRHILPAFLSTRNLPVTSKMIAALFEILNCQYAGYHKVLFVKAKVIELMALQFEQYEQMPAPDITSSLKEEDIEKMHLAREILVENVEAPLSMKDLAHQIGTNEFNLKKYFKEVFGTTVFGYLHDFRMEKSKEQLCQEGCKISDIAQRMGYKHATHFTAAFKKYYGFLPTKMRIGLFHLYHLAEYAAGLIGELQESGCAVESL